MSHSIAFRLRLPATAVLVAAALLAGCGDDDGDGTTTAATGGAAIAELGRLDDRIGQPIYWVGERDGKILELVEADAGRVYVRYLDEGEEAGVRSAEFLTIATYPTRDPVAALRREAKRRQRAELAKSEDGAVVLIDPDEPSSVYLAYPGDENQIEVYSPDPREAVELARSGAVDPVR